MRIPGLLFHIQFLGALVDYRFCHSLEMSNFQLADIRPWLPSKTVAEIYRRTHGSVVSRQLLNASLIDTQPSQILHAFVQHIGLPGNTMLLKGRAIAAAILQWSLHGFGNNGSHACINLRSIHIMQTILLEWLMPASARHIKSHEIIWQLSSSLAAITGLHDLWRKARVRKHLRVILRAFHPNIQDAILKQHSESSDWKRFLTQIFRSIWEHNKINHECMNYFMWSIHSRTWYTGITETSRSFLGSKFLPGAVARYREHMSNTFKFNNNRNESRYKAWKQSFPCELGFLPMCWSSKVKTATFERNIIMQLQAPLQDRVKVSGFRPSRYRPWPHHRKRLTFEQERSLNLSASHPHEQKLKLAGVPAGISDFDELRRWRKREHRESQKKVKEKMYHVHRTGWLTLYLAQMFSRLKYKLVWNSCFPRALMLGVWCQSRKLPRSDAARVQAKTERFLGTSPLTRVRTFKIRIDRIGSRMHLAAKTCFSSLLNIVRCKSEWQSEFIRCKVQFVPSKTYTAAKCMESHIQFTMNLQRTHLREYDVSEIA